jgi:hypothetical protein
VSEIRKSSYAIYQFMSVHVLHHDKLREHDRREENNKSTANHRRKWNNDTNKAKTKKQIEINKFTHSHTSCYINHYCYHIEDFIKRKELLSLIFFRVSSYHYTATNVNL